jgi:Tfp pilus assembly protein PilN
MANLLPTKELSVLKVEQRHRLFAAVSVLVSGLCILGTALFIPTGIVLFTSKETTRNRLATTKQIVERQQSASAGDTLADTKEKMDIIANNEALVKPHTLIERVTELVPTGVSLDEIAFMREEPTVIVEISGGAVSRSALLAFSDALKGSGLFAEVVIPIESLAQNTDLRFHLTLTLVDTALTQL